MFFLKKLFFVSCLLFSTAVFSRVDTANAEAFVGDTENIKIDKQKNQKAIEILQSNGDLDSLQFPIEKLTTEPPIQEISTNQNLRAALKRYYADGGSRHINGFWQMRCTELAPVGFNWTDNGIPKDSTTVYSNASFSFKANRVWDTGVGAYDKGYYWRNIGTPQGSFWASVWNLNDLLY
jgi:hypothetical protein